MGTVLRLTDKAGNHKYETILDVQDAYDCVVKYAGYELKEYIENYIQTLTSENEYLQSEIEEMNRLG